METERGNKKTTPSALADLRRSTSFPWLPSEIWNEIIRTCLFVSPRKISNDVWKIDGCCAAPIRLVSKMHGFMVERIFVDAHASKLADDHFEYEVFYSLYGNLLDLCRFVDVRSTEKYGLFSDRCPAKHVDGKLGTLHTCRCLRPVNCEGLRRFHIVYQEVAFSEVIKRQSASWCRETEKEVLSGMIERHGVARPSMEYSRCERCDSPVVGPTFLCETPGWDSTSNPSYICIICASYAKHAFDLETGNDCALSPNDCPLSPIIHVEPGNSWIVTVGMMREAKLKLHSNDGGAAIDANGKTDALAGKDSIDIATYTMTLKNQILGWIKSGGLLKACNEAPEK